MSDNVTEEKICKNCDCFLIFSKEGLCYYGEPANIFFFGPRKVSACDTCDHWIKKQTEKTR